MHNVLFKVSEPTSIKGKVEFYNISLSLEDIKGQQVSVVQETHGWWNNENSKAWLDEDFVSHPEAFVSFGDAVDRYCLLRIKRAKSGFMHSFSWHPVSGSPTNHKLVELPLEPRFGSPEGSSMPA